MSDPALILHVGAPKCGSSALQTALTRQPELTGRTGQRLRYVGLRGTGRGLHAVYGTTVQRLGRTSPYGYASWPNFARATNSAPVLALIREVMAAGQAGGWVPVLSCEGWINHAGLFAEALRDWGHPRVDVVSFLRPPVEWVNAAWWQWGIWSFPDIKTWLERGLLSYRFAADLEAWSAIPNLRLLVRPQRPDAVATFADLYDLDLSARAAANISPPPSLIGFLLRNRRRFRPTAHDARSEFIFQRWCPPVPGSRLWALNADHVRGMRPVMNQSRATLERILPPEDCARLFADPRWNEEASYHAAIRAGISYLRAPEDLPRLHGALCDGIAAATGRTPAGLPGALEPEDPVDRWDPVLAQLFERLLAADARARRTAPAETARDIGAGLRRAASGLWTRAKTPY